MEKSFLYFTIFFPIFFIISERCKSWLQNDEIVQCTWDFIRIKLSLVSFRDGNVYRKQLLIGYISVLVIVYKRIRVVLTHMYAVHPKNILKCDHTNTKHVRVCNKLCKKTTCKLNNNAFKKIKILKGESRN